jgi:hypothetical protein
MELVERSAHHAGRSDHGVPDTGGVSEPIEIVAARTATWFTEYYNRIGRITPGGIVTLLPIPTASAHRASSPRDRTGAMVHRAR